MEILASELILNPDGSVYHLNLLPDELGDTVFLVGDPDRVPNVSKYFDSISVKKNKREFITHTGLIGAHKVSVLSTGIGTDNIDIVLNELDVLCNIDTASREVKSGKREISLVRIGTSGALQPDIPVDSILVSTQGLGLDGLLWYYETHHSHHVEHLGSELGLPFVKPYLFDSDQNLLARFDDRSFKGITATCQGFYAPQGRKLRAAITSPDLVQKLSALRVNENRVTNFEMETAAILGLCQVFGFRGIAVNAIVANRITHRFSSDGHLAIDRTIKYTLDSLF